MPAPIFSRESILDAAREFARIYGRPPAAADWNVSMAAAKGRPDRVERFYADGCWPHTGTVQYHFPEGWAEMLRLAGLTPPPPGHFYLDGGELVSNGAHWHHPYARTPQTHCKYGHELTDDNVYVNPRGGRDCRECLRRRSREHRRRKRQSGGTTCA